MTKAATKAKPRRPPRKPAALKPVVQAQEVATESRFVYLSPCMTGVRIDEESVLRLPAFLAAIRFIGTLACLSWNVYKLRPDGGREHDRTNDVDWLLDWQANPEMTAFVWKELAVSQAARYGNHYCEIERDILGRPRWLWPITPPTRVQPMRDEATGRLFYRVDNRTLPPTDLDFEDVFHLRGLSPDGVAGYNIVRVSHDSLTVTAQAQEFSGGTFAQAVPAGVITVKGKLGEPAAKRLEASWHQKQGGPNSRRKVPVMEEGAEFKQISSTPQAAQMVESREFQVKEASRITGVPLSMLAHLTDSGNKSNVEQQYKEAIQVCLMPWANRLETEADVKLFGRTNRGRFVTRFDFSSLRRGDTQAVSEFLKSMVDRGVLDINEARSELELNPIGADGKRRFFPINFTTLDRVGEVVPGKAGGAPGDAPGAGSDNSRPMSALFAAHLPLFLEAFGRCQQRARQRAADALKRLGGDDGRFATWLSDFLTDQDQYAARAMLAPARALTALTGGLDPTAALAPFLARYRADLRVAISAARQAGTMPELNGEQESAACAARLCLPAHNQQETYD